MKYIHSQKLSGIDLRKFLVNSNSFKKVYFDYFRVEGQELQLRKDFLLTIGCPDYDELNSSLFLYLDAAISDTKSLSLINGFLHYAMHTIESYYQEFLWENNREDLIEEEYHTNEPILINESLASEYEQYIIYAHYNLGISLRQLARDLDSPVENIHRTLSKIKKELKSHL